MNCRKVNHLLSAYMDGELPGVEHRQIHEHIAQCLECAREYRGLLQMKRLLAGMRLREPQADLPTRILSKIHLQEEANGSVGRPAWIDIFTRWLSIPTPRSSHLAIAAGLAACGIIYASYTIDRSEQIVWHAGPSADIAAQQPAPTLTPNPQQMLPAGSTQIGSRSDWLPTYYETDGFVPQPRPRRYAPAPSFPFLVDPQPYGAH